MEFPKRQPNRLENYDYSHKGAYFITLCVQDRRPILSHIPVGASSARPTKPELSEVGRIVDDAIQAIPFHYPDIKVDKYVIMPNHIHLLLSKEQEVGQAMLAPTNISRVIQQMKSRVTKQYGETFWQKSFYDHIIRDDYDYQIKWKYIDDNPIRWCNDEFYIENL